MSKIIAAYEQITGESFEEALHRMARENCCGYIAAELVGFSSKQGLDYAIKKRGIEVKFRSVKLPGKSDRAHRHKRAKLRVAGLLPVKIKTPKKSAQLCEEHPWRKLNREIGGKNEENRRTPKDDS